MEVASRDFPAFLGPEAAFLCSRRRLVFASLVRGPGCAKICTGVREIERVL